MSESRVESVVEGVVVVTEDDDGLVGALLTGLLAEADEARLQLLTRGTRDELVFAGLQIRRFRSAIDLMRPSGTPTWSLTRGDATTTIHGELVERLFDQAYEHRRAAHTNTFPLGGRLAQGTYTITETLRGIPDRGMYRARDAAGAAYLVTLGPPQQPPFTELRARLALEAPGIAPLVYIGRLEPHSEAGYEAMVEAAPAGVPSTSIEPAAAAALALQVARVVGAVHATGHAIGTLRPELIYVEAAARPVLTVIAPRAERFWITAQRRSYGVPPCFDHCFQAPELLAAPFAPPTASADVFSLGAMLAFWLTGEPPFEGEGANQAVSIAIGRRRPWRGPASVAPLVDAALAADPAARPSLAELVAQLAASAR